MTEISQGKILIAQPFLNDGHFKRSVILMAEHNENGSLGFVVNRPMNLKLKDVLPKFPDFLQPLFYGGPVAENQLFFIHRVPDKIKDSMTVSGGYYWSGDFEDVIRLLTEKQLSPLDIKFFIGYSGWEAGQLEAEMKEKAWFAAEADYKNLMKENTTVIWPNELKKLGTNLAVLANFPEEPSLN